MQEELEQKSVAISIKAGKLTANLLKKALEKALGKKAYAEQAEGYVVKRAGKPALVPETDNRPAITNKVTAEEAFKEETDHE